LPLTRVLLSTSPGPFVVQGPLAFWKGAGPSVMKLAPQSVISLVILDNITFFLTGRQAM